MMRNRPIRNTLAALALAAALVSCNDSRQGPLEPGRPAASLLADSQEVVADTQAVVEDSLGVVEDSLEVADDSPEVADDSLGVVVDSLEVVGTLDAIVDDSAEVVIGTAGGVLEIPGGHSLYFPAGALPEATTIQTKRHPNKIRAKFGPKGLQFPESALPILSYSYLDVEGIEDIDPARLVIVYLNEAGTIEEVLPTELDPQAGVVRARIRHFSTYALATD